MDYTQLLKRAWDIVWNNKFMFVLGFLAALGGGGGSGGGNSNFNFSSDFENNDFNIPPEFAQNIEQYWAQFAGLLVLFIGLAIILAIVFWLVSLIGQAGLISSASRLDAGENTTLKSAFSDGVSKLGSMVGLNLVLYGPFLLLGIVAFGFMAATIGTAVIGELSGSDVNFDAIAPLFGSSFICFALLACLMVPISIVISIVYPFAQRGIVLKELGIIDSIKHGWKVVRENVGDVIVLIIIFAVIGVLFGIVAAVVLVPIGLVIFLPTILSMVNGGTLEIANIVFMIIGGIFLGLLGAAINSIFLAYRSTAVTLAYEEFGNKAVEKL